MRSDNVAITDLITVGSTTFLNVEVLVQNRAEIPDAQCPEFYWRDCCETNEAQSPVLEGTAHARAFFCVHFKTMPWLLASVHQFNEKCQQ
jgi:hypothetical protein